MGEKAGDVEIHPERDFDDRRDIIALAIGQDVILEAFLLPIVDRSEISPHALNDLVAHGLLPSGEQETYTLRNIKIRGQPVFDCAVRVGRRPRLYKVDVVLGRDFCQLYTDVHWNPRTNHVTLIDP